MDANPSHSDIPTGSEPDGEAARAREARRTHRLAALDTILEMNLQAAERLTGYIRGQLTPQESEPFARMPDPCLALERLTRAVGRTVALQEKIDEDTETREARLKAEQAARDTAERAEQARRAAETAQAALDAKKLAARRAVRDAYREDTPDMRSGDREGILDLWFRAYEIYDGYDGDIAEIAAKLCAEHNLEFDPALWAQDKTAADGVAEAATAEASSPSRIKSGAGSSLPRRGRKAGKNNAATRKVSSARAGRANGHDPP